ncbi:MULTISPECIES: LuxR family transcriptional regulator [unclassified Mesorhizobium]|uniref:LuxR family transcriptional regulator n=1 Tax=unclassified Mesorhizobium TaxID=325217 RepID=UPI00333D87DC
MSDQFSLVPPMQLPGAVREASAVELGRLLDQTDGVAQPEQLFDLLSTFALKFDCPWIAYGSVTPDRRFFKPVRDDSRIMVNFPDEWQQRCSEMGYGRISPIIKAGLARVGAFRWSEVHHNASTTEGERRVLDEAATFGLRSGLSVPLHGPYSSLAIMSFARPWNREFPNRTISYLQLAAIHFHLRVAKRENWSRVGELRKLSLRESECLLWVARGKTSWEIGKILGVSVNTVNFHIKNVMQKLDTTSRTAAAIKAANLGIIKL